MNELILEYKSSLLQFNKLYHHIDSFLECLETEIHQELQRKYTFSMNNSKSEKIV